MQCRPGCGACCVAPSITSAIPGIPSSVAQGKAAGVRCVQLTDDNQCAIFGDPRRPAVCANLRASVEMCGANVEVAATRVHAMRFLTHLEQATR